MTSDVGIGWIQVPAPAMSGSPSGSALGGPRPDGSARRLRPSIAVRQAFVAMR
ncbi:MAG TPA: hypothetical protein VMU51_13690 [Mycobacteriales bacterium]|nr:hypothetical protein [Mycobacteriales bacterium]